MKTILIVILSLALLAAAFLTRPGKREFVLYLLDNSSSPDGSFTHGAIDQADRFAKSVTIKDRILWTDIEKEGKVIYTGAFAHWAPRGENARKSLAATKDVARILAQQTR